MMNFFFFCFGLVLESWPLLLMVDAEVAILADTFCVQGSFRMLAHGSFLGPSLWMVTVLTHAVCVVGHIFVSAPPNLIPVLLFFNQFSFRQSFLVNRLLNARNRWKLGILSHRLVSNVVRYVVLFSVERMIFCGIMVVLIFEDSVLLLETWG